MAKPGAAKRQEISNDTNRLTDPPAGDREGQPSPIDVHVGGRIRLRRTLLQMSQERLGDALGLTFQQVQKYERGANRVGASRLFNLSRVLDVPVSFFFDDMPTSYGTGGGTRMPMPQPQCRRRSPGCAASKARRFRNKASRVAGSGRRASSSMIWVTRA